jgi:quinol monooxygenase YgiN
MLLSSLAFRTQPHKRAEVLSVVDDVVARMRHAPGCVRTRLLSDADDPNVFNVAAEWRSAGDAEAFFGSRGFQMFTGIRMLLRDEPVIVLDEIAARVTRLVRGR